MESGFRRLTEWQGLAPTTSATRAFTCRLRGHPGVFGVLPLSACPGNVGTATYQLYYFPVPADPVIDQCALPSALAACDPKAEVLTRNFTAYPDFAAHFVLADMHLSLTYPHRDMALSLTAPVRRRIISSSGLRTPDGDWLVKPGDDEENLPAFDLARDLFCVLCAGVAASLGRAPDAYKVSETPAHSMVRHEDSSLSPTPAPDALIRTEALAWGRAALAAWPDLKDDADAALYRLVRVAAGAEEPDAADTAALKRPKLIVLSGFLGSGKTSFLNQFIEFHLAHDQLVGVIQNEIGETGVDANLLEGEDSVLALDAGCVCCSLAGSLTRGLRQLSAHLSPEFVVLETTGLANPMNMMDEFHEIGDLAELSAVISVVDAARFYENLAASDVTKQQIAAADVVILNKCDLVGGARRADIEREICGINPSARVIQATNGRVNPSLLGHGLSRHAEEGTPGGYLCDCGGDHHVHGVTHMDEGFAALRLPLAWSVNQDELLRTLKASPPNVFRVKGVARLDDSDEPTIIQYVPGHAACEAAARDVTDKPFILIIGRDLDESALRTLWLPLTEKDNVT